jgi:DNA-binding GntR family transcriptional regulator
LKSFQENSTVALFDHPHRITPTAPPMFHHYMDVGPRMQRCMPKPRPPESPTFTLEVFNRLREEITRGQIRPNERLVAADLAERLHISRTPVREALQLLASEGLVVGARRGYVVRDHTPNDVREIYEVRAALEGMAARLAAERATDGQLHATMALHADNEGLATSPRDQLVEINDSFHRGLIAASGNPRLERLVRQSTEHFFNHRIADLYTDAEARASVEGHARVVEALRTRDAAAAERAAREHVLEALDVTLRKLR